MQKLEQKISNKVNVQKRLLKKVFIDFGPYPMMKQWQISKKDQEKREKEV